ncbi:hypothetical protein [Nocardia sp. NPDC052566]|uniref:hypothetical protein n=1 Tax=Nocardia sp. NPDC052566 TaxID=3364330 RepID=UPI0037C5D5D2
MRRTPQEKKQLSYCKDRRNDYGENDKASRKNLPRKRARVHRANRHHAAQILSQSIGPFDPDRADHTEQELKSRRPKVFRKSPDVPLGDHVARQLAGRAYRASAPN